MNHDEFKKELINFRALFYHLADKNLETNDEKTISYVLAKSLNLTFSSVLLDKRLSINDALMSIAFFIKKVKIAYLCGDGSSEQIEDIFDSFLDVLKSILNDKELLNDKEISNTLN